MPSHMMAAPMSMPHMPMTPPTGGGMNEHCNVTMSSPAPTTPYWDAQPHQPEDNSSSSPEGKNDEDDDDDDDEDDDDEEESKGELQPKIPLQPIAPVAPPSYGKGSNYRR